MRKPNGDAFSDYEEKGNKEMEDYFNNNYEYIKGKGWVKKDED